MVYSNVKSATTEWTLSTTAITEVSSDKEQSPSERIRLTITNTDSTNMFRVRVDGEPTANLGIPVYPGGQISWEKDTYVITQKKIQLIAAAGTPTAAVYEEVI